MRMAENVKKRANLYRAWSGHALGQESDDVVVSSAIVCF
jgi:hypothetical protein